MLKLTLVFIIHLFGGQAHAGISNKFNQKNISYKTYLGECPTKSSGMLAVILMKEFEKNYSLRDVKEKILTEKLDEKYFLSDYRISYNPVIKTLKINFECSAPIAKIQVYRSNGQEHYSAILAENAKIYEPQYEILMRLEKKLNNPLPHVALTMEQVESSITKDLSRFILLIDSDLRNRVSEIIVNKNSELTMILAMNGKATTVFLGADMWEEKLTKLSKLVGYVGRNKRYPSSINLINAKKVVVKFSDKI